MTDKDETVVTTSILHFKLQEPTSAVKDANDDNESTLVCRAYNPAIKTIDHHYIETKITLDVQCKLYKRIFTHDPNHVFNFTFIHKNDTKCNLNIIAIATAT